MIRYFFIMAALLLAVDSNSMKRDTTDTPITLCEIENNFFQAGEEITYKIYYNVNLVWLGVGEVKFKVTEDENYYYTSAYGNTFSFYDMVFKVRDSVETVIDKATMLPVRSKRVVNEGKYSTVDLVTYDYEQGLAFSKRGKSMAEADIEEIEIQDCSRDILSTIYGIRNVAIKDFQSTKQLSLNLLMDRKNYPIKVNYLGEKKEKIKGRGKQMVHVINPEMIQSETFKDKDAMKVYVSADGKNIPLMIESQIAVGKIKAVLDKRKGIRYTQQD